MKSRFYRFCVVLLIPFIAVLNCPVGSLAASSDVPSVEMEIEHDPVEEVTAGERIELEVEIEDDTGVREVRAYFKSAEAKEYVFIILESDNGEDFSGTLPAAANGAGSFEYLFLVLNGNNVVVKTQNYKVVVEDDPDANESIAGNEQLKVYTELQQAPVDVEGFSDSLFVDTVESVAKLGIVGGLYSSASAGSSASGATAAGTVTATTAGVSATSVIIGTIAVAAVAGGVAAALSSSSDSDDESEGTGASSTSGSDESVDSQDSTDSSDAPDTVDDAIPPTVATNTDHITCTGYLHPCHPDEWPAIVFTFSEPMDTSVGTHELESPVGGDILYSAQWESNTTFSFFISELRTDGYGITIELIGFKDVAGNSMDTQQFVYYLQN